MQHKCTELLKAKDMSSLGKQVSFSHLYAGKAEISNAIKENDHHIDPN